MDQRAIDTLSWLDAHASAVAEHPGAAYAEVELLRALVEGVPHAPGVFGTAYVKQLERAVGLGISRAEVRAVCHYIMFAGDFQPGSLSMPTDYAAWIEDAILAHHEDTDTLAEILIAAMILGLSSASIAAAQSEFDTAWAALPRQDFNGDYHAVLVGGILYAMTG